MKRLDSPYPLDIRRLPLRFSVELVGAPKPWTGTFLTLVSGGSVPSEQLRDLARFLVGSDQPGGTIAFIYCGLSLSFDEQVSELTAFQRTLAEHTRPGSQTINISHRGGIGLSSAAELMGAHYGQLIALSGTELAPAWQPQKGTKYLSLGYPEAQQFAEQLGVEGLNHPMKDPSFEHRWYCPPSGSRWGGPLHSGEGELILSAGPENEPLLSELRESVLGLRLERSA
ncbi:hypothetical protein FHU41_001724 [Psychromicrobium silvestre]|uniref:Alpha/beta hydrolase family n=1 Tax=Psychromicrobium silvestre TaxID=1645614 RepID=A0A7Y9LTW2_9MICC|nr:hypothetical protein [Psychromicrobium silvestre]NYE95474.1 hypothetical protein [Psychromicrobium silvestre]